jgi:hypothetical protein
MAALFELAEEFRALADKLNDSDLDAQTIADTLDGASCDFEEKITSIAKYKKNIEAEADAIKAARNPMEEREKALRKKAESLAEYMKQNMEKAGVLKVPSPWFVVSVAKNPASVIIDDESMIPADYKRDIPATFQIDKSLVKNAIADGYAVPGAHISHGTSLRIK